MPFVQAPNSRSRQNSSPKRPRDAASRASTAPSDAPKVTREASKPPFGGLPTKAQQEQRPRKKMTASESHRGLSTVLSHVVGVDSGTPDIYEKGDPLGSPSPVAHVRASPPRARATRPGGRRRPSLPQGRPCSTLGAGRLNFRVRYGSGCAPAAVAAGPRGALRRGLL